MVVVTAAIFKLEEVPILGLDVSLLRVDTMLITTNEITTIMIDGTTR